MKRIHLSLRARIGFVVVLAAVLMVGLLLDLRFHGVAWRLFYSVTGEESPAKQLYGFVQYLGNWTRRQPDTGAPMAQPGVVSAHGNPHGVNTFFDQEVEESKRELQMQMIADAGFGWIRQQFPWADIEISGRGDFVDKRNDPKGIDAWQKYDNIVDLAEAFNVEVIARLGKPPQWSEPQDTPADMVNLAPPGDVQDFVNYAAAVATRYKGRIRYYQVWNEPNIYPEWGRQAVNPEAYTDLLCRTHDALKAIDPSITIISATLAQTIELTDANLSDFVFLQRMYNAGAKRCFDILGAQGYGLFSGPSDRRMRLTTINFSHVLWLRDMMIANDDANKPIWIGEMAWNYVPDETVAPQIVDRLKYGQVTEEQAARYAVEAYRRARDEWPFVGVLCYWFFKPADDHEQNQSQYYFRMVDPDFTPHPVYNAIMDSTSCQRWLLTHTGTCVER